MKVRFSDQPAFKKGLSIFLAGPTPRSKKVPSWRPEAIETLKRLGFKGTVLVPERQDWTAKFVYTDQVDWEYAGLDAATVIVFWIPRKIRTMPGFTTNIEFGLWVDRTPGKVVYGRPDNADRIDYPDWLYSKFTNRTPLRDLEETLQAAIDLANSIQSAQNMAAIRQKRINVKRRKG